MATVNFSVPDDVKRAFNAAFDGQNKSAVIAALMMEAVERQEQRKRRAAAIDGLLALRRTLPPVALAEVNEARAEGRP